MVLLLRKRGRRICFWNRNEIILSRLVEDICGVFKWRGVIGSCIDRLNFR